MSMNLLAVGLSLLCFVDPLHSDPQQFYRGSYESHNPAQAASLGSYWRDRAQTYPERYSPSDGQNLVPRATRYERTPRSVYRINHSENSSPAPSYPEKVLETEYHGYNGNDDDIVEKMRILDKLLSEDSNEKGFDRNGTEDKIIPEESKRVVRQVRKQKPGFFWTVARITFESINDTKSAIKQISEIINNNIAPDSVTQSTMTSGTLTAADGSNATTTQAPFVLTRSSLQNLIRRNVLGLVRLFNIEWKDALNQSEITVKEFQRNLGNQVGMYLRDNPDAY